MFELASAKQADPIIQQAKAFKADSRQDKINLGIGVYKDDDGLTPVMKAVKMAEKKLLDEQMSKEYVGVTGDEDYLKLVTNFAFPDRTYGENVVGIQAVGGSGALRILFEAANNVGNPSAIWIPTPTWANHKGIATASGLELKQYAYLTDEQTIDFAATLKSLEAANAGDLVVVHLCCHNPTGVDFTIEQMNELAKFLAAKKLVPIVDAAYVGFGDNFADDLAKLNAYIGNVPELLLAMSFSKNFGIYRERTGAAFLFSKDKESLVKMGQNLGSIVRPDYSMPPDHGAKIVRTILEDGALKKVWLDELEMIRNRIIENRQALAENMRHKVPSRDWSYVAGGKGMFCRIEIGADNVAHMIEKTGIYIIPDGRTNIAGITDKNVDRISDALAAYF